MYTNNRLTSLRKRPRSQQQKYCVGEKRRIYTLSWHVTSRTNISKYWNKMMLKYIFKRHLKKRLVLIILSLGTISTMFWILFEVLSLSTSDKAEPGIIMYRNVLNSHIFSFVVLFWWLLVFSKWTGCIKSLSELCTLTC